MQKQFKMFRVYLCSGFRQHICMVTQHLPVMQRSYQGEYTRSHQNTEVKHLWAGLVLGRVISWEPPVTLCFCV